MPNPPTDRLVLATWPTPLEPAPRLARAIGLNPEDLWLKRDDLTGLAAGGNKVRKLEWLLAAALRDGADTLVTTGAPQSNHARLTAAAGVRHGLRVVLVFPGAPPESRSGNLLLDDLLGATVRWAGDRPLQDVVDDTVREQRNQGRHPAVVPYGGSNAVGAHGYRLAAAEILAEVPQVRHVVCALGSGGTMAGLVAILGAARVVGVHTGAVDDPRTVVAGLLDDMAEDVDPRALRIRLDQVGDGYSSLTPAAGAALRTVARTEGVALDPIYTARALAGLTAEVRDGTVLPGQTVVFLASGGLPGLFADAAVEALAGPADVTS